MELQPLDPRKQELLEARCIGVRVSRFSLIVIRFNSEHFALENPNYNVILDNNNICIFMPFQ